MYYLIIVTRKAVISYRAKVSWIRTNGRQVEMFSVKETKACPTLLFLMTHLTILKAYETDFIMYQILLFFFGITNGIAY